MIKIYSNSIAILTCMLLAATHTANQLTATAQVQFDQESIKEFEVQFECYAKLSAFFQSLLSEAKTEIRKSYKITNPDQKAQFFEEINNDKIAHGKIRSSPDTHKCIDYADTLSLTESYNTAVDNMIKLTAGTEDIFNAKSQRIVEKAANFKFDSFVREYVFIESLTLAIKDKASNKQLGVTANIGAKEPCFVSYVNDFQADTPNEVSVFVLIKRIKERESDTDKYVAALKTPDFRAEFRITKALSDLKFSPFNSSTFTKDTEPVDQGYELLHKNWGSFGRAKLQSCDYVTDGTNSQLFLYVIVDEEQQDII